MSVPLEGLHFSMDSTLGAVFIGLVLACIMFGMTSLQAYLYYHQFQHDSTLHMVSVAVLWILSSLHLVSLVYTCYFYGVTNYGDTTGVILKIIWSIKLSCLINVVIVLIVQSLYAYRVWLLGGYHRGFLGYFVAGVVGGGFIIGIVLVVEIYLTDTFMQLGNISWAIDSSLAAATTIDAIISFAMCYYLRMSKGRISALNSKISTLMQYCLSSGLLTTACSLGTLFTFTFSPNTLVFLGLQSLSTQLYVGSFLTMLNARNPVDHQETKSGASLHLQIKSPASGHSSASSAPSSSVSEYKGYLWDLEAQKGPMPKVPIASYKSSLEKPDYMKQW